MKRYVAKRGKRIGKPMMGCIYIHKSAIDTLNPIELELYTEKLSYLPKFDYTIIKIDVKKSTVSFINSFDWDSNNEPSVGDSYIVKEDNSTKFTKGSNLIYHHKWMFVKDDYTGFDVSESKKRSELWMNHPYIIKLKNDKTEKFNSRIGRRDYWINKVCSLIDYPSN